MWAYPTARARAFVGLLEAGLHRNLGGWEQIIADLEVNDDPDPALAVYGRNVCAPIYLTTPTQAQRARLRELLADAILPPVRRLDIAQAAGVR